MRQFRFCVSASYLIITAEILLNCQVSIFVQELDLGMYGNMNLRKLFKKSPEVEIMWQY
jgi:hypothetical protein